MSDDQDVQRVVEKIQKILSRTTEKGASEEEAASAMRIAQQLCMKHNLDMAEIEAAASPGHASESATRVKEEFSGRARFHWQRTLARYVAEANFCYHLIVKRRYWRGGKDENGCLVTDNHTVIKHMFVGRKGNVVTAQLMFNYLTQAVEDNLPKELFDHSQRLSRSANSWKEGCATRLCQKLARKRRDLIDAHDAAVRAQQEELKRQADAAYKKVPKQLEGNPEAEVKSRIEDLKRDSYDARGINPGIDTTAPEVNPDDTWSPTDAVAEAEAQASESTSTAMVLASVYDEAERDANYEAAWGLAPGTLARERAELAAVERRVAEAEAKRIADGIDAPVREETERQRKARERQERAEAERNRRRWAREDEKERRAEMRKWEKTDHSMYNLGAKAGDKIGIDAQVQSPAERKLLK